MRNEPENKYQITVTLDIVSSYINLHKQSFTKNTIT